MKVSFYLSRPDNSTPTVIFARICFNAFKFKYYLPESILPANWNKETQRAKETKKFPEYPEFNRRLDNIERDIKNTIRAYINDNNGKLPNQEIVKNILDVAIRDGGPAAKMDFISFFHDFITRSEKGIRLNSKGKPITPGTVRSYHTTLNCLENYLKYSRRRIDFDGIDMVFYADFTKYLTIIVKQSTNYIGKHIKTIKTVLGEASELGFNKNEAYRSKGFSTIKEDTDSIYLAEWELEQIENIDLSSDKRLDNVRDLLLVGCRTGLRFSDLSSLTESDINGDFIKIVQIKTGDPVIIPVHETVKRILAKHGGRLPRAVSNQKTNKALKELGQKVASQDFGGKPVALSNLVKIERTKGGQRVGQPVPKWELITTHTARRTFASLEYLAGTPAITIMSVTGHRTEKAFLRYIKITPDEHAKLLREIWEKRKTEPSKTIAI